MNIDDVEVGIDAALSAVISVAQTTMAQVSVRGENAGPFVGFIQAIVANREAFKQQITVMALEGERA